MEKYKVKFLGLSHYQEVWEAMQTFTESRTPNTVDEIWVLEHPPVFTLGLAGKKEHLLFSNHNIPIIQCDRGGQITYHGPGQLVFYALIDLKRANLSIRKLVECLENGVINYLNTYNIHANSDVAAPGVYIAGKKIASIGLKVRKGCTYHGLSFNINMDITPFNYINVCGYNGLQVTQLKDHAIIPPFNEIANEVATFITSSIYGKGSLK